jgi:hypothetical protein
VESVFQTRVTALARSQFPKHTSTHVVRRRRCRRECDVVGVGNDIRTPRKPFMLGGRTVCTVWIGPSITPPPPRSSSSGAGSSQQQIVSDGVGHSMGRSNERSLAAENLGIAPKGKRKRSCLMPAHPTRAQVPAWPEGGGASMELTQSNQPARLKPHTMEMANVSIKDRAIGYA